MELGPTDLQNDIVGKEKKGNGTTGLKGLFNFDMCALSFWKASGCLSLSLCSIIETLTAVDYLTRSQQLRKQFTLLSVLSAAVAATRAGSALSKSASHSLCFWDASV